MQKVREMEFLCAVLLWKYFLILMGFLVNDFKMKALQAFNPKSATKFHIRANLKINYFS